MLKGANRSYWRARDQVHVSDENGRAIMTIARWPNVVLGPLGERMAKFLENYPKADEIYITSGRDGDHGDVSHHYGLSYGGSPTAAIDIGADGVGCRRCQDARFRQVALRQLCGLHRGADSLDTG